ncbi:hypothetical protein KOI35_32025 [Actinoplanes bogorensis]|uniref:Solute-binding protein family 5 domain-containing protein n=1 Tax=Paractinoplanes bogorensis TaxID=1610840 RepID=A0ABS5YZM3_9ACTN|nr:ABC transporter substrate-binding protein [Actinoplanes bogorensis]MBU2668149.1 hypothetical protein [Actinoplanes bogorensis]
MKPRVWIAAVSLVALGACSTGGGAVTDRSAAPSARPVTQGGSLVIGAEQEPDCADWIATCAGAIWGTYTMQVPTIPQVFDTRKVGGVWAPVPSDMMAGEPQATMQGGKQVITYKISPKAVWSDGKPISSADLKYTALQIRDGDDIFDKTGYDRIEKVDTPDAATAVVTLKSAYAGWRSLFSVYGVLPAHLLEGKDRAAIMKDGYSFSGGPWKIASWQKGTSVTLVPNDKYWGDKPKLDKVTFSFLPDTSAAFQALKSGQVDALYPSPQLDAINQIKAGLPGIQSQVDPQSGSLEAVWFNNAAAPFDSAAVRQAFSYAIDRKAIVQRIYGGLGVTQVAQSFNTPIVGAYAGQDFSAYQLDLGQVDSLMTGDGWAKGADGVWAKSGQRAEFTMVSLAANKRRDLMVQILQEQLKTAGFAMSVKTETPANLFSKITPKGAYQAGLWSLVDTFPDPTLSATFNSANIPSDANGFSGINFIRAKADGLDGLLEKVDTTLEVPARTEAAKQADAVIAKDALSLPLDTVPLVLLWADKVGGPLAINPVEGPFWNLEQWGIAS